MTRRKGIAAEKDVGMQALRDAKTEVATLVGKSWDLARARSPRREPGGKPGDDPRLGRLSAGRGTARDLRRRTFLRRLRPQPRLCPADGPGRAGRRGRDRRPVRHQRRQPAEHMPPQSDAARQALSLPIGIHCHNDCDVATANSLVAVRHGAVQVQGTVNGIGERCGNVDLIGVIAKPRFSRRSTTRSSPAAWPI